MSDQEMPGRSHSVDAGMSIPRMRESVNQSCFPGIGTESFAECVAAAGFRHVELRTLGRDEPISVLQRAVQRHDLRVEAINGLMDWALPDDRDPGPALARLLEVAGAVGAPLVVCAGPIRQGSLPPHDVVLSSATERLARMAEMARSTGVRLALEQVGRSSTRPGALSGIKSLDDALTLTKAAGEDVLLVLDSYNLHTADESLDDIRRVPLGRVGIAQVAGSTDSRRGLPAEGDADNSAFIRSLGFIGYSGAVSLEMFPSAPWDDPSAFAVTAFAEVRALIEGLIVRRTTLPEEDGSG